tara:strand:+ start:2227 stop:3102 length:876 start_codon:yes stop_codon:yes gene_type:complete
MNKRNSPIKNKTIKLITSVFVSISILTIISIDALAGQTVLTIGGSGQKSLETNYLSPDSFNTNNRILSERILFHPGKWLGKKIVLIAPDNSDPDVKLKNTSSNEVQTEISTSIKTDSQANSNSNQNFSKGKEDKSLKIDPVSDRPQSSSLLEKENVVVKEETLELIKNEQTKPEIKPAESLQSSKIKRDELYTIFFPTNESDLELTDKKIIKKLTEIVLSDKSLRLQLKAYATGNAESASQSRRLSLSRALSVRTEFIENGLRSTRIDVRALGHKDSGDKPDRVDIFINKR